jgi:hypothetical protein
MNPEELALVKEGLQLADDALARLMEVDNEHVKHVASMLHSALWFGELILGGSIK